MLQRAREALDSLEVTFFVNLTRQRPGPSKPSPAIEETESMITQFFTSTAHAASSCALPLQQWVHSFYPVENIVISFDK
jgi:hypothetical protein